MRVFNSLTHAVDGLKLVIKEPNFRIHIVAAMAVYAVATIFDKSLTEFAILTLAISSVMTAEAFNTAIEEIGDVLRDKSGLDYQATKHLRDISAGAVLLCAMFAVLVAVFIFMPELSAVLTLPFDK